MNYQYDISIIIPAFRTPYWPILYKSLENACKNYNWELVLISPFELPQELKDKDNILLIRDFGNVPRCVQIGVKESRSPLFFLTVDDCIFAKDSIDLAMEKYSKKCRKKDAMAMLYGEGGNKMAESYWTVAGPVGHPLRLPGVNMSWKIANQCLMSKEYFIELGGLDCENFIYLDKPIHDFMFRLQRAGGKIHFSPKHVCIAAHFPNESGDHKPIHNACLKDAPTFNRIYSTPDLYNNRIKLNFDNWKLSPALWKARFSKGVPETYEELCNIEGYDIESIDRMKKQLQGFLECELQ